ncbi:MAG: MarR family transcriptional regulator [Pseudomonadota bacterium]
MTQAIVQERVSGQVIDFSYGSSEKRSDEFEDLISDAGGVKASIAVFANRSRIRDEISEDLAGAGLRALNSGPVDTLLDGPVAILGDVVIVDCPEIDGAMLAALARLDQRVASNGAYLIVSTTLDALDDVFVALDQSQPQILVQPTRAERLVAVGRVMADVSSGRVREMSDEDRLDLLYLSRQVEAIAHKLEGLSDHSVAIDRSTSPNVQDLTETAQPIANEAPEVASVGLDHPPLPDPGFVRRVIAARHARAKFFDAELFADPAWDMLLDLTAAHGERSNVSVTSLCIAAAVPATTALRWLKQMVDCGIFERVADPSDKRRAFIALSESSLNGMARYFHEIEVPLADAA